jgi:hypothetical protein
MTGLALQTSIQRAMFDRWGDNLLLDWTHGTNNIGYYLGTYQINPPGLWLLCGSRLVNIM